ncbi:MAG: LamG domain-containing protein [Saprospirales bacterium]|nr:LamG domain-containing protein [Saprospirales bacterium]
MDGYGCRRGRGYLYANGDGGGCGRSFHCLSGDVTIKKLVAGDATVSAFGRNCAGGPGPTTNTLTIEAWVWPDGLQNPPDGIVFFRSADPNGGGTGLNFGWLNSSKIGYHWNNNSSTYNWTGGPTYVQNAWNHVALVIEPTKATIYLNGTTAYVNNVATDQPQRPMAARSDPLATAP